MLVGHMTKPDCPLSRTDCPLRPSARERKTEMMERVVYVERLIKKFDREGSESMEQMRIPEFVEEATDVEFVTYSCDACGHQVTVRENPAAK